MKRIVTVIVPDGYSSAEEFAKDCGFEEAALPREPTEAMLNAARDWSVAKYGRGIGNDGAIGCWQAMLDAWLVSSRDRA